MANSFLEHARQQEQRKMLQRLLERRFGPLSLAARERLATWPPDRLLETEQRLFEAQSLQEFGLEG